MMPSVEEIFSIYLEGDLEKFVFDISFNDKPTDQGLNLLIVEQKLPMYVNEKIDSICIVDVSINDLKRYLLENDIVGSVPIFYFSDRLSCQDFIRDLRYSLGEMIIDIDFYNIIKELSSSNESIRCISSCPINDYTQISDGEVIYICSHKPQSLMEVNNLVMQLENMKEFISFNKGYFLAASNSKSIHFERLFYINKD